MSVPPENDTYLDMDQYPTSLETWVIRVNGVYVFDQRNKLESTLTYTTRWVYKTVTYFTDFSGIHNWTSNVYLKSFIHLSVYTSYSQFFESHYGNEEDLRIEFTVNGYYIISTV